MRKNLLLTLALITFVGCGSNTSTSSAVNSTSSNKESNKLRNKLNEFCKNKNFENSGFL